MHNNTLCLLPGPLDYSFLTSRFILLDFFHNLFKQRLRNVRNCERALTFDLMMIVFRPDISDWALKPNDFTYLQSRVLPIYDHSLPGSSSLVSHPNSPQSTRSQAPVKLFKCELLLADYIAPNVDGNSIRTNVNSNWSTLKF